MNEDLINAFETIGLEIDSDDIPIILRLGADKFLSNIRFCAPKESLTTIHIILTEMRETKIKNS